MPGAWTCRSVRSAVKKESGDATYGVDVSDITNRKLSEQDAINIRYRLQNGEKAVELANEYDVSKAHISDIKHYKCWPNAGQPGAVTDLDLPGFEIPESELHQNVAAERLEFWERLRTGP